MMLKQKSSPWARLKYLYVLPLTAVAVVAFARPEISHELEKISSAKISEIVPVKEVIEQKKAEPVAEAVPVSEEKPVVKVSVAFTPQTVRVIQKEEPVMEKKEEVNTLEAMQQQLEDFSKNAEAGMQKVKQKVEMSRYLILIDNEVATYEQMDKIVPENIYSYGISPKDKCIDILTKHNASEKQGLISIVTKVAIASGKIKEDEVKVVGHGPIEGHLPGEVKLRLRNGEKGLGNPLVIIDGVEQFQEGALERLDPKTIESISVLKEKSSAELYGKKGENGVIIVKTKKPLP